jgi:formylglycine-generating enzyme required for sulfatase activity
MNIPDDSTEHRTFTSHPTRTESVNTRDSNIRGELHETKCPAPFPAPKLVTNTFKTVESNDPGRYLTWLRNECGSIEICGLKISHDTIHRFDIEELYTPLHFADTVLGEKIDEPNVPDPYSPTTLINQAFFRRHTAVTGDPGTGKSTFLHHVTTILCQTLSGEKPNAAREKLGLDKAPLPLFICIRELAAHIIQSDERKETGTPARDTAAEWIMHYIADRNRAGMWNLDEDYFRALCVRGEALLLFDGLDEIPGKSMRERIAAIIDHATRLYNKCPVIVTSRPGGYEGNARLESFAHYSIAALTDEDIRTFLRRVSRAFLRQGDERKIREYSNELLRAVSAKPEIRHLAVNPLMLTALAVLYWNEKCLPDRNSTLYESIITWLLLAQQDKARHILSETVNRRAYQRLAFAMQTARGGRLRAINKIAAASSVSVLMPGTTDREKQENAGQWIDTEQLDSRILVSRSTTLEFRHLVYQQYLAAKELSGMTDQEQFQVLFENPEKTIHHPEWRDTLLLFTDIIYRQGENKLNAFFKAMLDQADEAVRKNQTADRLAVKARCFGLMGTIERELAIYEYTVEDARYRVLRDEVMGIFRTETAARIDPKTRFAIGDALGQAVDPRIRDDLREPRTRKEMLVEIAAGEFWMGAQKNGPEGKNYDAGAYPDEAPVHLVSVDTYAIGRYPVTVSQFRQFVDDRGYEKAVFWRAGGFGQWEAPYSWDQQTQYPNRPVVSVCWYEAMAFCAWAGLSLPSEPQWERAARGPNLQERIYPWGDAEPDRERANYDRTGIGHVTPVGCFPAGNVVWDSDNELYLADMVGNVWEWCSDWYSDNSELMPESMATGPKTGDFRVVRGGSWLLNSRLLRCAARYRYRPDHRSGYLGFRVVR